MEITTNLGLKCPEQNETFDVEHMNDNMRILDKIWEVIYPVGSLYISVNAASPADLFGGGTWSLVASNRVLMGTTDETKVGTTVEAGLPNITGWYRTSWGDASGGGFVNNGQYGGSLYGSHRFSTSYYNGSAASGSSAAHMNSIELDASRSNSIYGKSTTVQPPALLVYIWQRTA